MVCYRRGLQGTTGIIRVKTMDEQLDVFLIKMISDDKLNYAFFRLKLLVEKFEHY